MTNLLSFLCVFLCFTLELRVGLATRNPRFLQEADGDNIGISEIDDNLENENSATTNERKLGGLPPLPDLPFGIPNPVNKIKEKFNPPAKSSPAHGLSARHLGDLPTINPRFLQGGELEDLGISEIDDNLENGYSDTTNERKLGGLPPLPDLPFGIPNPVNKIKEKFSPSGSSSHATGSNARHLGGLPPLPDLPFGIPNPVNKIKEKFTPSGSSSHATGSNARHLGGLPPLPDLPFGIPNPLNKIKGKMSASRNLGGLPLEFPKLPKLPFSDIFHKEESHSSSHQPHHSPMNHQQSMNHGQESHGQGMPSFDYQHIQHSHDPIPHGLSSFDQQHTHLGRDPHEHGDSSFFQQHAHPGQESHGHGQSSFGHQHTEQEFKQQYHYGHE